MADKTVSKSKLTAWAYNKKRKVFFGTLADSGWFSAAPDDLAVNRAIRTNNPGALNISSWQRARAGYVGQTQADGAGNVTTIYQTPEHGITAWYHLLSGVYGFGGAGKFDLTSLGRKYAGANATLEQVKAYTDGWKRWSGGALKPASVIRFASDEEMLAFGRAEFAHEADEVSPLTDAQILSAFKLARDEEPTA